MLKCLVGKQVFIKSKTDPYYQLSSIAKVNYHINAILRWWITDKATRYSINIK